MYLFIVPVRPFAGALAAIGAATHRPCIIQYANAILILFISIFNRVNNTIYSRRCLCIAVAASRMRFGMKVWRVDAHHRHFQVFLLRVASQDNTSRYCSQMRKINGRHHMARFY